MIAKLILIVTIIGTVLIIKRAGIRLNLPHGAILVIDGAVKSGKTKTAVSIAIRDYRRALIGYYIKKIFNKEKEKPLFYSNIPVDIRGGYVKVTKEIITREQRLNYGSVVLLSEASLVADNMLYKNKEANIQVMLFAKLFGHETKGGKLIIETQSIGDLAVALRRCISAKWYIDHSTKLPLFSVMYIRQERYTEDTTTVNTYTGKDEFDKLIVPNSVHKKYDTYAYSILTDDKPIASERYKPKTLKCKDIVTFDEDIIRGINEENSSDI